MEFERQKLVKRFRTELQAAAEEEGQSEEGKEKTKQEEGEPIIYVDYK